MWEIAGLNAKWWQRHLDAFLFLIEHFSFWMCLIFSPLLIRFRLCTPGQKNYISDAVSPWYHIWRCMMCSCPLWVILDHLFGQNVWFFFFYPLELTDLWRDILGLCKCPTVHQHFTLGLTCTGDWFLPEPIFSVVVIKMVVFQLRSPSPFTLLHLHWYGVMGSWFSPWFIIYYWPVLSPILYLYILSSTVRALVPSTIKNI